MLPLLPRLQQKRTSSTPGEFLSIRSLVVLLIRFQIQVGRRVSLIPERYQFFPH